MSLLKILFKTVKKNLNALGMARVEVRCSKCSAHMGKIDIIVKRFTFHKLFSSRSRFQRRPKAIHG